MRGDVLYPEEAATGRNRSLPAPPSSAEVKALLHVTLTAGPENRMSGVRLALAYTGTRGQWLSAIHCGPDSYREATIRGDQLAPVLADRLAAAADRVWVTRRRQATEAALTVRADQRVADAVARWGPIVLARLLLYRAAAGRLEVPLSNCQGVTGARARSAAKTDAGQHTEIAA